MKCAGRGGPFSPPWPAQPAPGRQRATAAVGRSWAAVTSSPTRGLRAANANAITAPLLGERNLLHDRHPTRTVPGLAAARQRHQSSSAGHHPARPAGHPGHAAPCGPQPPPQHPVASALAIAEPPAYAASGSGCVTPTTAPTPPWAASAPAASAIPTRPPVTMRPGRPASRPVLTTPHRRGLHLTLTPAGPGGPVKRSGLRPRCRDPFPAAGCATG